MCDKMAISTYIMKIAENDPFLLARLPRLAGLAS